MLINVTYNPNAHELARASSLYIEKKPFFKYAFGVFNLILSFFVAVFAVKLCLISLTLQEKFAAAFCVIWLVGRRRFNEWLLLRRMKNSLVIDKPLSVEMSLNGIAWSGKGLRPGSMGWEHFKYILEAENGFLLPNSLSRFLWLPFRGFASSEQIEEFKQFLAQRNIERREFKKWRC